MKAADLPEGSVVEYRRTWTKRWQTPAGEWQDDVNSGLAGNWYIDELFQLGAVVLRHGYGEGRADVVV